MRERWRDRAGGKAHRSARAGAALALRGKAEAERSLAARLVKSEGKPDSGASARWRLVQRSSSSDEIGRWPASPDLECRRVFCGRAGDG